MKSEPLENIYDIPVTFRGLTKSEIAREIVERDGIEVITDEEDFEEYISNASELEIKFGTDPTSPNVHIGRMVPILNARSLQDMGHNVTIILGDYTAEIGDTSDKDSERPMLSSEIIEKNIKTYEDQILKILDPEKTKFVRNSEFYKDVDLRSFARLLDMFSLGDFIKRENIAERLKRGARVSLRETIYPVLQGYDSHMLKTDIELGGVDQRFNLLAGREIQSKFGEKSQSLIMAPLIMGTDGRKMSSSYGNTVNLMDTPMDMFGKIMRIPDEQIREYLLHCSRVPLNYVNSVTGRVDTGELSPMEAKKFTAYAIVSLICGQDIAKEELENFEKLVQRKELPEDIPSVSLLGIEGKLLHGVIAKRTGFSNSEITRLIKQGGVSVNGTKLTNGEISLKEGDVIQVGKRTYLKVAK